MKKERIVATPVDVAVVSGRDTEMRHTGGALGYGTDRPFEMLLGIDGLLKTWVIDVSVAVAGIHCPPAEPAGRGLVQISRCAHDCVLARLRNEDSGEVIEAHYAATAFCQFLERVTDLYEAPELVADDELAAVISRWEAAEEEEENDGA
jgi:hypothetical protein